ncbi:MAG: hypothetical protein K6A35_07095 [bacterium]|nr:hypothetical protein [bacterium]
MGMKNDVSFLIANTVSFYEQQSSFNPNMPMRLFIYAGMVYAKYIEESDNYYRYSTVQQKAPTPKCVCFYNGEARKEDKIVLKLSDSFDGDSDIEVKVTMININYGHNKELLEECRPLKEYSWFVDRVRFHKKTTKNLEESLETALKELPSDSLIKPFLIFKKAEVKRMCITEYDEARAFAEQRAEGKAEGLAEGLVKGIEEGKLCLLISFVEKGFLTLEQAAKELNVTAQEFEEKASKIATQ